MDIISKGPELPDPSQLDLFAIGAQEADPVKNSTVSAESSQANEPLIRSPTFNAQVTPENGKNFDHASSLHRKSRELVKKSYEMKLADNDLAR
ncbi:MAG: hypothetical protein WCK09_00240 [Bacteroidota bacterium]